MAVNWYKLRGQTKSSCTWSSVIFLIWNSCSGILIFHLNLCSTELQHFVLSHVLSVILFIEKVLIAENKLELSGYYIYYNLKLS